jgi:hypothetical protein
MYFHVKLFLSDDTHTIHPLTQTQRFPIPFSKTVQSILGNSVVFLSFFVDSWLTEGTPFYRVEHEFYSLNFGTGRHWSLRSQMNTSVIYFHLEIYNLKNSPRRDLWYFPPRHHTRRRRRTRWRMWRYVSRTDPTTPLRCREVILIPRRPLSHQRHPLSGLTQCVILVFCIHLYKCTCTRVHVWMTAFEVTIGRTWVCSRKFTSLWTWALVILRVEGILPCSRVFMFGL